MTLLLIVLPPRINTLFKYIDAGYDVMISNESDKNGATLTVYHYFDKE